MIRTHYSKAINPRMDGKKVTVAGWIQHYRDLGSIRFLKLRDKEGLIQIILPKAKVSRKLFNLVSELSPESVIAVTGKVKKSKEAVGGFEIVPEDVDVLSKAEVPLPLDISGKIKSEMETRLNARFMDLRSEKSKAIFMIRDSFLTALREFSESCAFIEIHTPKIVLSGAEGGATLFPVKYFGKFAYLSQSPQLFKQMMMATGFDRVYEIAPYFRAEKSATTRHVSEFTQWDIELAFIDSQEDFLDFLEKALIYSIKHIKKNVGLYLDILRIKLKLPKTPFPRVKYSEVVKMLAKEGKKIPKNGDLDTESEKVLGNIMKKKGYDIYFITEFPSASKPFYVMEKQDNPKFSHSFDIDYKGLEIASGGQREHRYDELIKRMKKQGLNPKNFEFYVNAFRYGMPPHGGFGFGVDRFIKQLLDLPNVRETILFPRDLKRLVP